MEKDFSKEILDKIRKGGIKPKSKWHFMLKDYVVWFLFVLSIVLGSLAFSIMLHFWGVNDWDAYYRINSNFLEFVALTMPYFWLLGFLLFLVISYFYLKHTNTGYRYEFAKVVALNVVITLILGSVLYSFGAGRQFENEFAKRSPFYNDLRTRQTYVWFSPDHGVIMGKVVSIDDSGNIFILDDPHEEIWTVDATNANYMPGFAVRAGLVIKVFGTRENNNFFVADEVRPLMREQGPGFPFLPHFAAP